MMSICFQLYAEVEDIDELLEMVRSTCDTDYITLDGITQPLQLINLAKFFKKYCMLANVPSSISKSDVNDLGIGYYKGLVFDIPGAEVLVDGQWMAYDAKNKDLILAQNPMTLSWRLNGSLLRKLGYTSGETVEGQIITVDDQWHGLSLTRPISVQIQ